MAWSRCSRICDLLSRTCKAIGRIYKDAPTICLVVISIVALVILILVLFSTFVARVLGVKLAVIVDLLLFWLFARLVARALMFPGSLKIFQRSTEANYRVEVARHYVWYVRHLWHFLRHASHLSDSMKGVTLEGLEKSCSAVVSLAKSLRTQEQQEVRLSAQQREVLRAAEDSERWLPTLQVRLERLQGPPLILPMREWLLSVRQEAAKCRMSHSELLGRSELVSTEGVKDRLEQLQMLLSVMEELRNPQSPRGMLMTLVRFLQAPTVGSLGQLRAELQLHYSGQQLWVPTRGNHRLDAMFIPCQRGHRLPDAEVASKDEAPLLEESPTLIWCNPNAAYYEAMVYQPGILKFWLNRGCNLFLFNYAGYGRSSGKPSPSRVSQDGEAVVRFLRSRGVTNLGIYGRSIGGVAACYVARRFPEVKILITDRTMSTLEGAARYMYGGWAAKGLRATSMVADNTENFLEVQCHKVLICDPRDQMILDPAALRTEVALKVLERLSSEERIQVDDGSLKSFEEAWRFFDVLFSLREGEEDDAFCGRSRQLAAADSRPEALEERGEGRGTGAGAQGERLKTSWLEDHPDVVRLLLPCEDQLQQLFELCEGIEGAGVTLPEALEGKNCCHSLRCLIANMQVWGAVGNPRAEGADFALLTEKGQEIPQNLLEIDQFLSKDDVSAHYVSPIRLEELMKTLHPDVVARYHRQLARMRVTVVWREFRRRQSLLQGALGNLQVPPGDLDKQLDLDRLVRTVLLHLDEIGGFISLLAGFFKSVDLVNVDDAQAGHDARPVIDRSQAGYAMHVDCGHNGPLDEVDLRQLELHLRVAHFGMAAV